jgi:hypothetical protein
VKGTLFYYFYFVLSPFVFIELSLIELKGDDIEIECSPLVKGRVRCRGKRNGTLEGKAT